MEKNIKYRQEQEENKIKFPWTCMLTRDRFQVALEGKL